MPQRQIEGVAVVTGASGFIGSRLRDTLLNAGVDVIALRRPGSPPAAGGRSVQVDYARVRSLMEVFESERPDYVFHVAGATKGISYGDFQRGNVMPTGNLLQALKEVHPGLQRFVYVSSLTAYGPSPDGRPLGEDAVANPVEFYGKSKLQAERAVEAIGDALNWTIIRPAGVYGPGDVDNFELFKWAARGLNLFYGNREKSFSCVHVDDLVAAIIGCTLTDATVNKGYFICDGQPHTWTQFQQHIVNASGRKVRDLDLPEFLTRVAAFFGELATRIDGKPRLFNRQKAIMGAQQCWTCTHDAARNDFGYAPRVDIGEGIRSTFDWYRSEGWL